MLSRARWFRCRRAVSAICFAAHLIVSPAPHSCARARVFHRDEASATRGRIRVRIVHELFIIDEGDAGCQDARR